MSLYLKGYVVFNVHLCIIILLCHEATTVRVRVEQGILEGETLVPSTGKGLYYSFKGIPYAEPPLGKLRFKAPRPPLRWRGVRDASEHGPICVQHETVSKDTNTILGSEDCLYLNVYSPNLNPAVPYPVMFYIHGGYFITDSGNSKHYAPDFLMKYNVVLVTINYRLDALGFLSVDTEEVPGNAGMKDQIAAMQWVKRNIRRFGGDPDNVTIFGQSAGSVSVTLHLLSPAAKSLFQRAIGMSGALCNDWSISFEHKKRAFALGRKLGCNTTDPHELIDFLQTVPAKDLLRVRPNILISDEIYNDVLKLSYFTPIVEKKFCGNQYLTEHPAVLLREGRVNKVHFMTGHTEAEGWRSTTLIIDRILNYYPQFEQLYAPVKISNNQGPLKVLELAKRIKDKYTTNGTIISSIRGFVKHVSYLHYVNDIHNFVERYSDVNNDIYFYIFAIYSTRNFYSKQGEDKFGIEIKESTHNDDVPYIFDGSSYNMTVTENSPVYKYIEKMCTIYTNFAKYGVPSVGSMPWPRYGRHRNVVIIDDVMTVKQVNYNGDLGFWKDIYRDAALNCSERVDFGQCCVCNL